MTGAAVQLYGAAYSVYVRAVRLALEEKGVAYDLIPVDIFAEGGPPADYAARQPFLKIPALEHDGFRLYETGAILRYLDAAFPVPPLGPEGLRARARQDQIMGILDAYAYRTWVWDIYVERVAKPAEGGAADEERIERALPKAALALDAIADLMTGDPYFLGEQPCLADLLAGPMIAYLREAKEGAALIGERPRWAAWWRALAQRPSWKAVSA